MHLPEAVLKSYRNSFRDVIAIAGPTLHDVLKHFGELNDDCWLLLNRITDWRHRYAVALLESDRMICSFWGVRCDVQNGGFHQYFVNSAGDYWPDLLRMLQLGSNDRGLNHFRRVLSAFPDSTPEIDRAARNEQLRILESVDADKIMDHFDRLDTEYYDCIYPENATLYTALLLLDDVEFVPDPDVLWTPNVG